MKTQFWTFILISTHFYTALCHGDYYSPSQRYKRDQFRGVPYIDREFDREVDRDLRFNPLRSLKNAHVLRQRLKHDGKESLGKNTRNNFQNDAELPTTKKSYASTVHEKVLSRNEESERWNKMRLEWMDSNQQSPFDEISESKVNSKFTQWILHMMGKYYLPSEKSEYVSQQCREDVNTIYAPKENQTFGAISMIDSWGKIPDGFLAGNTKVLGSFDECLNIQINREEVSKGKLHESGYLPNDEGSFKGKYCLVEKTNNHLNTSSTEGETIPNAAPYSMMLDIPFVSMYGTCMPSSCSEEDLEVSLNEVYGYFQNDSFGDIYCQTEDQVVDFDGGLIAMTVILSIFGFLLITGAVIDIYIEITKKDELRKGNLKYILVFSFYTNLQKMFQINTSESKEVISCLHGIRVLSMTWVLWGHNYMHTVGVAANLGLAKDIFNDSWLVQIITNATPSVDSFFFMSGLLVAYGVLKEKERSGKVNMIVFYIHRFLRLSVPIALVVGFYATFSMYLGHGPLAGLKGTAWGQEYNCRNYWWRDTFFVSNFDFDEGGPCLGVTWFTSVDFQLFIVTPIFLLPFIWGDSFKLTGKKKNVIGLIWLGIVTLTSGIIPAVIGVVNEVYPNMVIGSQDREKGSAFTRKIYMMPWCRASPYLVGMGLGILLRLDAKRKIKLQWWQVVLGWVFAVVAGIAVVFGMYDYNQLFDDPGYNWADTFFYAGFHTMAWGFALAWIVFACQYGYAGPINTFLSHPGWQPISRLTYCIFLISFNLQTTLWFYGYQFPFYLSHLNEIMEACGVLIISGIGAVPLSLISEAPVIGLQKYLLRRDSPKAS